MHLPEHGKFNRKDISVTMERMPDMDMYLYGLECRNCQHACDFHFMYPRKLSFVFAAKLVGAFSSPCKRLAEEEERRNRDAQDGQLSLLSNVEVSGE